jgi:Uma2 family endonuclease
MGFEDAPMSIAGPPFAVSDSGHADAYSDPPLFELVDGRRVDLLMSAQNDLLGSQLLIFLGALVLPKKLGYVVHEVLFELPLVERTRSRRPDLAFVSFARWPENRRLPDRGDAWPVVPDLAIELLSPNDEVDDLLDKLEEYFEAGVRQAWVVHPRRRVVYVFNAVADVHGLREPAEIDGGEILPGIRVPVSAMLPPMP